MTLVAISLKTIYYLIILEYSKNWSTFSIYTHNYGK